MGRTRRVDDVGDQGNAPSLGAETPPVDRTSAVRTQRIPEMIAADIRKRILRHELTEGDSLPAEAEMMVQYGVSRPTLREALRILEAEQLIVIRRGGIGGALVKRPELDNAARQFGFLLQDRGATLGDIHRARTIIEPPSLAALAVTITPAQLAYLNDKLAGVGQTIGDPERYSQAAEMIREEMVEMTGATTIALIMRLLRELVQKHTTITGGFPADRWVKLHKLSQKSHQRLLDIVGAGRSDAAEEFWREHLAQVEHYLGRAATMRVIDLID
jgi:DNA-binding FadR family transcriptional regulator